MKKKTAKKAATRGPKCPPGFAKDKHGICRPPKKAKPLGGCGCGG